jgi:uncharacterized coiled-coil protein SlyX
MLDIKQLNTKTTQLYEQDTIFINQINDLYMRTYENAYKIKTLESIMTDQRDIIDRQKAEIHELTIKTRNTRTYHVAWQSGHHQTLSAHSANDAHAQVTDNFTGADKVIAVYVDNPLDEWDVI